MKGMTHFQVVGTGESWIIVASDNWGTLWYGIPHVVEDKTMEINWTVMKENV